MPAAALAAPRPLTAAQIEAFHRDGWLVADGVLGAAELDPVIAEIEAVVDARARELHAEGKLTRLYEDLDFERRLAAISLETDELAKSIWNGALAGPAIFNLIRAPRLLDVAEQFCGPELIASSVYRLRPKIPHHVQGPVPWHQDSGYLEAFCDDALVVTMWIPLVDANEQNGCLWVIPGAHKGPVARHSTRDGKPYLVIEDEHLPAGSARCVPVKKGSVLLLHNRTPHASFENDTDRVRWSMDLRYQSAALPTNAPITRLPGERVETSNEGVTLACYPPEADFLVRSRLRPGEVVTEAQAFHDLRKRHQFRPVTPRWKK